MPNMPALVNKGMSCLVANKAVTTKNKNKINSLFLKVGKTLWLRKEKDINIHSDDIILLEQIRSIGEHQITVNPYTDIKETIVIKVLKN